MKSYRAPRWRDEASRDAAGRWDAPPAVMLMLMLMLLLVPEYSSSQVVGAEKEKWC